MAQRQSHRNNSCSRPV